MTMEEMKTLKLELTLEEVQYIFNCIGDRPMKECEGIINKIRTQVAEQEEPAKEEKLTVKK
jgi:hypothetical protein